MIPALASWHKKMHGHRNALGAGLQREHEMLTQNRVNLPQTLWRSPKWRISLPAPLVILLALPLTALNGVLIYVMGRDVAMSALSLAPICWAIHNMLPQRPISVLTAFGSPDVKAECLRQGARAFLENPLDTPHLLGVVEEIFASQTPDPGADAKKEVPQ